MKPALKLIISKYQQPYQNTNIHYDQCYTITHYNTKTWANTSLGLANGNVPIFADAIDAHQSHQ